MLYRILKKGFFFIVALASFFSIQAEIQEISIEWTAALCQASCEKGLMKEFKKVKSIQKIELNPGRATIHWDPSSPFSYYTVDRVMQMIGLSINAIRIKVKGKISHTKTQFVLNSLQDNTKFHLLSSISPHHLTYNEKYNIQSHPLFDEAKQKFLQAEQYDQVLLIEGPLFQPDRSPPLQLIAEKIEMAKEEKRKN